MVLMLCWGSGKERRQRLMGNLAAVCTAEGEAAGAVVAAKASPCDICRGGEREKATGKRKKEKVGKGRKFSRNFVLHGLRIVDLFIRVLIWTLM
jgi:hypothetical protein